MSSRAHWALELERILEILLWCSHLTDEETGELNFTWPCMMEMSETEQELGSPVSPELLLPQLTESRTKPSPSPHLTSCYSDHLKEPLVLAFSYSNPTPCSKAILELSSTSTLCSSDSSWVWAEVILPVSAMSPFNPVTSGLISYSFIMKTWWEFTDFLQKLSDFSWGSPQHP